MSTQPIVELKNICKTYPGQVPTPVLFDINLSIYPGEFVGLVGASGSGKTTLLNIMGLLDTPTSGELTINSRVVSQLDEDQRAAVRRNEMGFIFQFHYLLPEFDVLDNALMPCRLNGSKAMSANKQRITDLLTEVGLQDRLRFNPSKLSGGQQQRVAIVRALANNPAVILADEPTGNLDSRSGNAVFEMMRYLAKVTHKAFVIVTHDEAIAAQCDRIIHLEDGRISEHD